MPNLEIVRLEAGHTPNAERPDEFNRAVLELLARRSSG